MIRAHRHDDVLVLEMARGKGNALNAGLLEALLEAIRRSEEDPPAGLVLTGERSTFCAGLDLVALADADRSGVRRVLHLLYEASRALFAYPRPVVAALNGHAIAGGAYLSLACDRRFMAQGEGKWGLNESALGLPMPAYTIALLRYAVPRPILEKLLYQGSIYPAFKALDMGILDDLTETEQLIPAAVQAVRDWGTSLPAFADVKLRLKGPALDAMASARAHDDAWLDLWFGEEAQKRIRSAKERLLERTSTR